MRKHLVLDFLIDDQEVFDNRNMKTEPYTVFHADNFTFTKSDGTGLPPGEASWKGRLKGYLHSPITSTRLDMPESTSATGIGKWLALQIFTLTFFCRAKKKEGFV